MAHHTPYPDFELECVTEIVRIVRNRAVAEERKAFAKHCYTLIGAGLKLSIGEPDNGGPILAGDQSAQLEQANDKQLEECRSALEEAQGQVATFGAAEDDKSGLDPATLALILQVAMKLIEAIINRRKNR